jgi:hypothetical protein
MMLIDKKELNEKYPLFTLTSKITLIASIVFILLAIVSLILIVKNNEILPSIISCVSEVFLLILINLFWVIPTCKRYIIRKNTFFIKGFLFFILDNKLSTGILVRKALYIKKYINEIEDNLKRLVVQEKLGKFSFTRREFSPITTIVFSDKVFIIRDKKRIRVNGVSNNRKQIQVDVNNTNLVSLISHELGHLLLYQLCVSEEEAHIRMAKVGF